MGAAAPAAAITYVGAHSVGAGTVALSITTDGALGVLGEANILDWSLQVTSGSGAQDLFGPLRGDNSVIGLLGTALSATPTQLLFDFDGRGKLIFTTGGPGFAVRAWGVDAGGCLGAGAGSEHICFGLPNPANPKVARVGLGVLGMASESAAQTPEPKTWSLMAAAFGLAGAGLLRRPVRRAATGGPRLRH